MAREYRRPARGSVLPEAGWDLLELAIQPDHVHLFVRVGTTTARPRTWSPEPARGDTSHDLPAGLPLAPAGSPNPVDPELLCVDCGQRLAPTIQRYIEAQKGA